MFNWLHKMGQRGGHPMLHAAEADRLLAELPRDDPLNATEEVTAWLESLACATRFGIGQRLRVISMVDEAGQPAAEALMAYYLDGENAQKAGRFRQWQVLMNFWQKVADAYMEIVASFDVSQRAEFKDQIPLVTVRAMHAVVMQMRLAQMRYASEPDRTWSALYRLFSSALNQHCATSPVRLYSLGTHMTTARNELVSAVMLDAAAPQTLPPRQIELTSRIVARLASAFAFSDAPGERLHFCVDLATTKPAFPMKEGMQATANMRFVGPGTVINRLNELIERIRHPHPTSADPGLGEGYTVTEQLETLQRLLLYWGDTPPRRKYARTRFATRVDVVFGLDAVMRVVGKLDQELVIAQKFEILFDDGREGKQEPEGALMETWMLKDISLRGLGALTTRRAQGALKIGALLAFRLENANTWCIGIVRRLQVDRQKNSDVGAEILSRNPQLFRIKKPNASAEDAWQWEARYDDATSHHYLSTVLLPYDEDTSDQQSLLLEAGSYVRGLSYTAQIEKRTGHLRFGEVLEQGENFERVAFEWTD
jgi:hypothetical protein